MKSRRWFTRPQVIFLVVVANAALIVVGSLLLSRYHPDERRGVHNAIDSMMGPESRSISSAYYATPAQGVESFEFDPNEADSTQLLSLGLAPFQVRSIYRYRAKGGRFSTPGDFRRVYRLTNEQWEHLAPLIRIARRYRLVDCVPEENAEKAPFHRTLSHQDEALSRPSRPSACPDSAPSPGGDTAILSADAAMGDGRQAWRNYPRKLSGDETLDLNLADSAQLCRVPGIGPYFARRIVDYRRRLGGYVRVEQLLQIDNFPVDAMAWLEVGDTAGVRRLQVNRLSTRQLMKHPYMGYYRASEIATYRRLHGKVAGPDALREMPHFTEDDIRRLAPYLDFD